MNTAPLNWDADDCSRKIISARSAKGTRMPGNALIELISLYFQKIDSVKHITQRAASQPGQSAKRSKHCVRQQVTQGLVMRNLSQGKVPIGISTIGPHGS
jgi:hypothetical protein